MGDYYRGDKRDTMRQDSEPYNITLYVYISVSISCSIFLFI